MMQPYDLPDEFGHFGQFGGTFVAETLIEALDELREMYSKYKDDPESRINLYRSMFRLSDPNDESDPFKRIHKLTQMDRLTIAAQKTEALVQVLTVEKSFEKAGEILQQIPGLGRNAPFRYIEGKRAMTARVAGFGAKEVLQDLQLSALAEYKSMEDRHDYCPIGPGAAKGIKLLLHDVLRKKRRHNVL
jgi:hypothetical protein